MDNKQSSGMKTAKHIYVIFSLLIIILVVSCIGFFLYAVNIRKPDGRSGTSAWSKELTEQFGDQIVIVNNQPRLREDGLNMLQEYNLWFQLLDQTGKVILSYGSRDTPDTSDKADSTAYSMTDLLKIANGYQEKEGETVFIGTCSVDGSEWTYLIGFSLNISKITMYLNGDHFTSGKPIILTVLVCAFLFIVFAGFSYGLWITRQMEQITKSIHEIAIRTYFPVSKTGVFEDVYESMNCLDGEIRSSDKLRDETQKQREEWIANVTHDLKTPLSPVKGYAELLADPKLQIETDDVHMYGEIILKNTNHAEQIINDLKLVYQMENGSIPLHMERINVVRQLKELLIDVLNTPEYRNCVINYLPQKDEIYGCIDVSLFRRAVNNIIVNGIIHNPPGTTIDVSISVKEDITITVADNGTGLTKETQENMFDRYFRGTNTESKPEGTGLGMAIVKQIIEIHNGTITVESEMGRGTVVSIRLPQN